MLRKVYPGEQVECNNSSQHKIDHKIKGLNNDNRKIQKEEENITQGDRKRENETKESDFKIHERNRNDDEHEPTKEDTEIENRKMRNHILVKKTIQTKERKKLKRMKLL